MGADAVDAAGDDDREDLLARPHRLRLQDGRVGKASVPRRHEHEDLHHFLLYIKQNSNIYISGLQESFYGHYAIQAV